MRQQRQLLRAWLASDDNGSEVWIYEYANRTQWHSSNGSGTQLGRPYLETDDGRGVDRVSKGVYDVNDIDGPARLTSDDSDAP